MCACVDAMWVGWEGTDLCPRRRSLVGLQGTDMWVHTTCVGCPGMYCPIKQMLVRIL